MGGLGFEVWAKKLVDNVKTSKPNHFVYGVWWVGRPKGGLGVEVVLPKGSAVYLGRLGFEDLGQKPGR